MAESFPDLEKEKDIKIQEAREFQIRWTERNLHWDTLFIKLPKVNDKERMLQAAKENLLNTRDSTQAHMTYQIFQRKLCKPEKLHNMFKYWKNKNLPTKNTLPDRAVFQNWKGKTLPDTEGLKEFITTRLTLQEMLRAETKEH